VNSWDTALAVVADCLKAGVGEFVVCAGARNAALIEVLARLDETGKIKLWRHFEERSAGFFALGRTIDTSAPCAVVTTSGTAAAELLPAMVEAFYQARPLVAVTADRPAAYRGTGAPQSIVQPGIFGDHASVGSIGEREGSGPFHWNVELDEEFECGPDDIATWQVADFSLRKDRLNVAALARWLRADAFRGMVVMIGGLEPAEREEVFHFCRILDAPVLADATSGLREALQGLAIPDGDRVLRAEPPGKILRLGDVPSGRFWRDLEELPQVAVWSVCRNGLPGLARVSEVLRGPLDRVIPALGPVELVGDVLDYLVHASRRAARIEELLETYPDSEPALIRTLSVYASLGSSVFLGNSLPIREWNLFAQWERPVTEVRANRGANGIDGQASTWLGHSAAIEGAWAVLGDLTALYDLAAPFVLGQIDCRHRVLAVINNRGGRIFERLPRLKNMRPSAAECMTNPHAADLSGFAKMWDMHHVRIRRADDFDAFEPGPRTTLLEVMPDERENGRFWEAFGRIQ
jgi:2-succinyl-5-enolpyruvyl-6-hydroxy-3-cyclohexene-1-carboxylate synthase